jgi:hypothetical protein
LAQIQVAAAGTLCARNAADKIGKDSGLRYVVRIAVMEATVVPFRNR